jgi:AcrR family transcriptional regulator
MSERDTLIAGRGCPTGDPTRERLIEATEQLLAVRDHPEITLRDITYAAGANVAAVNYHFGSKRALVRGVVERALDDHAARVLLSLQELIREEPSADLTEVVRAYVRGAVDRDDRRAAVMAGIAARVLTRASPELGQLLAETHAEPKALLTALAAERLPEIEAAELDFRLSVVRFTVGVFQLNRCFAIDPSPADVPREIAEERLVGFLVAGLAAPMTTCEVRS